MPDAAGNFKGTGWTRKFEAAWDRAFGGAAAQQPPPVDLPGLVYVPSERTPEVDGRWDCLDPDPFDAVDDGERADDQAARDGYNPAW